MRPWGTSLRSVFQLLADLFKPFLTDGQCIDNSHTSVNVASGIYLDCSDLSGLQIVLQAGVEEVSLQQVIRAEPKRLITQQALALVDHRRQVFTLVNVVHMEAIPGHLLHQILSGIPVITDLKGQDFIVLNQCFKPVETVIIFNEVVSAFLDKPLIDIQSIGDTFTLLQLLHLVAGHEELGEHMEPAVFFDDHAAGCKVCGLGKVDSTNAIATPEIVQGEDFTGYAVDNGTGEPCLGAVLLDVAILSQLLDRESEDYDPDTAVDLLIDSAKLGCDVAKYRLGKMFLRGEDVTKNTDYALRWLEDIKTSTKKLIQQENSKPTSTELTPRTTRKHLIEPSARSSCIPT